MLELIAGLPDGVGLANPRSLERIAVVTDEEPVRVLAKGGGWTAPGDLRLFSLADRADAEVWIGDGLGASHNDVASEDAPAVDR